MRITAAAKSRTRARILQSAHKLFIKNGFETTTTRDIAAAAGIASGTLFNYFPSKEALGMQLLEDGLAAAEAESSRREERCSGLEEALFAYTMAGLRALEPYRPFVGAIIERGLSPFNIGDGNLQGDVIRTRHLERVSALLAGGGGGSAPSFIAMHLYWTLYLGVLAFWSSDNSPHQQDTLAVLDHSVHLFVRSLSDDVSRAATDQGDLAGSFDGRTGPAESGGLKNHGT